MTHPQSPLAARCSAFPKNRPPHAPPLRVVRCPPWGAFAPSGGRAALNGASPLAGETPATAIDGLACSAAFWLFGFHALRVARRAMVN